MGWIIKSVAILAVLFSFGTALAEEQTGSITVYLEHVVGTITIYEVDIIEETDPETMAAVMKDHHCPGMTKPVIVGKPTVFADLPQGKYLVTHEDNAFRPFLVTIPITINESTTFMVEAKPKTQAIQSPQTGDPVKPWYLCAALFALVIGIAGTVWMGLTTRKSSADGKMFLERVQNKQKRLR